MEQILRGIRVQHLLTCSPGKKPVLYQAGVIPAVNSCHTTLGFGNGNQNQYQWFVITSFKTQSFFLAEEKLFFVH